MSSFLCNSWVSNDAKGTFSGLTAVGGSASSSNGVQSSAEQKINQVSVKDEPSNNFNGVLQDGLSRLPDSINQDDKTRENSVTLSLKGIQIGRAHV